MQLTLRNNSPKHVVSKFSMKTKFSKFHLLSVGQVMMIITLCCRHLWLLQQPLHTFTFVLSNFHFHTFTFWLPISQFYFHLPYAADICGSYGDHCKIAKSPFALQHHSLVQGKKTLILLQLISFVSSWFYLISWDLWICIAISYIIDWLVELGLGLTTYIDLMWFWF